MSLSDRCCIVGVGETEYVRGTDRSLISLHVEAAQKAIADAGLAISDVDGVIPNPNCGIPMEWYCVHLGLGEVRFSMTKHLGGASLVASLQDAVMAISSGVANCVLMIAGRKGFSEQRISTRSSRPAAPLNPAQVWINEFEKPYGNIGVGEWFGAAARRHMHDYGTTSRQFGAIAVACRKHAMLNPRAVMRQPMSIDDHQNSRIIVDPLHLFDFSLETDGAGAVVVVSAEKAKNLRQRPIYLMGVSEGHPDQPMCFTDKERLTELQGVTRAARRAFSMAGVAHKDIDVAQFHDGTTCSMMSAIEDAGFCRKGEGGPFVEGGRIELGGELPVNTSGGSLSEAHVSTMNHLIEAVRQLRGDCGERQVKNARIGLVCTYGDFGDGGAAILRR